MQQRIFHYCILIVIAFARLGSTSDYPLLPGWTAHVSGGRTYYYHQSTGRSTWERPSAWQQQSVPTQSSSQHQQQPQPQYQQQQQQYQQPFLQQQQSYLGQTGIPQPFNNDQQQQLYAQQQPVRSQPPQQQSQSSGIVESKVLPSNNHNNNTTSLSRQSNTPLPGSSSSSSSSNNHDHSLAQTMEQPKNESSTPVEASRTSIQPKLQADEHLLLANELSMVTELRKADQQIDELNDYIDTLLEKIKVGEEERTALAATTAATAAAVVTNSSNVSSDRDADIEVMNELSEKIDFLQTELVEKNEEMVRLQTSKDILEKKLIDTSSTLKILQGNFTTQQHEIKQFKKRGREQEKELEDCYREIGLLETDLKNVAGSSMKRLTQRQSIFARLWDGISSHNPLQLFGLSSSSSSSHTTTSGKSTRTSRRAKGLLAAVHSTSVMNRTIATLRENITAMASALSSKETVVSDLTAQLAENVEEAEKRRQAYAVLKDGLEELNEENERLTMDLSARETQLNQSLEIVATLRNQLTTSTQDIHTEESKYRAAEQRLLSLTTVVNRQETTISNLQQQVVNATDVANSLQEIILASRNHSSTNSILPKVWYWFLLPWEW